MLILGCGCWLRCADGYYGNPLVAGGFCQPCDCSSNQEIGSSDWCDRLTGQCLKCKTGTAGQACQLCATGYYGNATEGTCQGEIVPILIAGQDFNPKNHKNEIKNFRNELNRVPLLQPRLGQQPVRPGDGPVPMSGSFRRQTLQSLQGN
jgi:hypothetical protein